MNGKQVEEMVNAVTKSTKEILVKEIVREMVITAREPGRKAYEEGYHNALMFQAASLCKQYLGHDYSTWTAKSSIGGGAVEEIAQCAVCHETNWQLRRYTEGDGSWEIVDHTDNRKSLVAASEVPVTA